MAKNNDLPFSGRTEQCAVTKTWHTLCTGETEEPLKKAVAADYGAVTATCRNEPPQTIFLYQV